MRIVVPLLYALDTCFRLSFITSHLALLTDMSRAMAFFRVGVANLADSLTSFPSPYERAIILATIILLFELRLQSYKNFQTYQKRIKNYFLTLIKFNYLYTASK